MGPPCTSQANFSMKLRRSLILSPTYPTYAPSCNRSGIPIRSTMSNARPISAWTCPSVLTSLYVEMQYDDLSNRLMMVHSKYTSVPPGFSPSSAARKAPDCFPQPSEACLLGHPCCTPSISTAIPTARLTSSCLHHPLRMPRPLA